MSIRRSTGREVGQRGIAQGFPERVWRGQTRVCRQLGFHPLPEDQGPYGTFCNA